MYTSNISELTVNEILLRVDELDIFSYYIPNLELGRTINSPLRKDKRPSFVVFNSKATKRRILYKDFATGDTGSCFDLVMQMYGVNLIGSLKIIDKDLNIGLSNGVAKPKRVMQHHYKPIEQSETIIEITSRKWNGREDKDFWSKYNIHASTLNKFGVYPIKYVWINGNIITTHKNSNPIYGYKFYKDSKITWKIYQPYSTDLNG
jgi:DNA primase